MTTRKHNEFLDLPSEDEEHSDRGYDSEENVTKNKGRNVKRRRTADTQDLFGLQSDQSDEEDSEDDTPEEKGKVRKQAKSRKEAASDEEVEEDAEEDAENSNGEEEDDYLDLTASKPSKTKKPLITKPVKPTKKSKSKPGVIYLSSLPPYLKPSALRSFLEQRGFAPITRVFLQPTVKGNGAPKRQSNKRKTYSDGWVEFQSKATAKLAAETLNCQLVGGKKGSWYHDDIWNMKYLRGYKWSDLMEQIQRERAERESRQRAEDLRAKREEKVFMAGVERGRVEEGMAKKNDAKRKRQTEAGDTAEVKTPAKVPENPKKPRRTFVQNDVVSAKKTETIGDDAKRVLGKIF
ncbi:unnamed protein product [Penicillium pancosmium]